MTRLGLAKAFGEKRECQRETFLPKKDGLTRHGCNFRFPPPPRRNNSTQAAPFSVPWVSKSCHCDARRLWEIRGRHVLALTLTPQAAPHPTLMLVPTIIRTSLEWQSTFSLPA